MEKAIGGKLVSSYQPPEKRPRTKDDDETSELVRQHFSRFYSHVYSQFRGAVIRRQFGRNRNREFGREGFGMADPQRDLTIRSIAGC